MGYDPLGVSFPDSTVSSCNAVNYVLSSLNAGWSGYVMFYFSYPLVRVDSSSSSFSFFFLSCNEYNVCFSVRYIYLLSGMCPTGNETLMVAVRKLFLGVRKYLSFIAENNMNKNCK